MPQIWLPSYVPQKLQVKNDFSLLSSSSKTNQNREKFPMPTPLLAATSTSTIATFYFNFGKKMIYFLVSTEIYF